MIQDLSRFVGEELAGPVPDIAEPILQRLRADFPRARAILFYGSSLRTGDRDGLMDFYVLTDVSPGMASRLLWPDVSYLEAQDGTGVLRAKVATMTLDRFGCAAVGKGLDTTIWTRFVQPARLVWSADAEVKAVVCRAIAGACITAAGYAAALGPADGSPLSFWEALFRQTYAAELRVESAARGGSILGHAPARWDALLPLAWGAAGLEFKADGESLAPGLSPAERERRRWAWSLRRAFGRPLNAARLVKAAFTFEGAARYAAWKIERHTGVSVPLTPWRERHPVLAAPGVLWRLWRAKRPN